MGLLGCSPKFSQKNQPEGWRCLAETMGLPFPPQNQGDHPKELLPQRSHLDRGQKLTGPALGTWKRLRTCRRGHLWWVSCRNVLEKEDLRPGFHSNKNDMNLQKFAVDRPKCRLHQESVNWQRTLIHLIRKNRVWNTDWLVRRDVPPLAIRNPWFFLTTWMFHAFSPHFQVPNGTKPFSGFPYTLVIQHNYVEDLNHRSISMRNVHESSMAKCDLNYQRLDSHQAPFKIHEIVLNPQFSMVS